MINNELKKILLDTSYFKDNEYLTAYIELVNKEAADTKGYSEKHHVIPAAVYRYSNGCKNVAESRKIVDADPKNYTVSLLYKDHVLAHYFLYFCTKGQVKKAMGHAVICMLGNLEVDKLDLSEFKYLPEQFEKIQQLIDHIYADPNNSFYTPYEVEFLKTHYSEKGSEWCAEQLNRQVPSVRAKAHRLRLHYNTPQPWTEEEIAILKQYYEENGPKYCKTFLPNRTEAAICNTAKILSLATRRLWTEQEINFLIENYNKLGGKRCAEMLNKAYHSVRNKASELKLVGGNPWREDELQILKENYYKGAEYCATLINRDSATIRTKANSLGLSEVRSYWSIEEIEFLKQNYESQGSKFCAENLPGRTRVAITAQANKLGLNAGCRWTPKEDEFLINNYAKLGGKKCAELLNRTQQIVYYRAAVLNLQPADTWTDEEKELLIKYYKTNGINYCVELLGRSRGGVVAKARELGLSNKQAGRWRETEIDFILKNYKKYGLNFCVDNLPGRTRDAVRTQAGKLGLTNRSK